MHIFYSINRFFLINKDLIGQPLTISIVSLLYIETEKTGWFQIEPVHFSLTWFKYFLLQIQIKLKQKFQFSFRLVPNPAQTEPLGALIITHKT